MISVFSMQINNEKELMIFAEKILTLILKDSIVLLSGPLSAGKTTLVSYLCKLFDLHVIQSPTYSIHHRYSNSKVTIDHFDLYRLQSEEDIQSSGFYDLLADSADYKFIEWPEKISIENFPFGKPLYKITIHIVESGSRQIDVYKIT